MTSIPTPHVETRQADASSRLAFDRTRLAYERTMLAWVRTATSLITFGFSVHTFFRNTAAAGAAGLQAGTSYAFGSIMVGIGLVALLLSSIEHRAALNLLRADYPTLAGYPPIGRSYARILAALMGALGITTLILMRIKV